MRNTNYKFWSLFDNKREIKNRKNSMHDISFLTYYFLTTDFLSQFEINFSWKNFGISNFQIASEIKIKYFFRIKFYGTELIIKIDLSINLSVNFI